MANLLVRQCRGVNCLLLRVGGLNNVNNSILGCRNISGGPIDVLEEKVRGGELLRDDHQVKIVEQLERVFRDTSDYRPHKDTILDRWITKGMRKRKKPPKGLYLYGAVGGGKTMLMDLFYNCCQVGIYF